MKRWLVCPFFNETEVFEIKLRELGEWADVIVVVEGNRTYAGVERELIFPQESERFAPWAEKIRYHPVDLPLVPGYENIQPAQAFHAAHNGAWIREERLRDSPLIYMEDMAEDDVVFLSDADEIVKAEVLLQAETELDDYLAVRFNLPQHVMHLNWRWRWEPQAVARIATGHNVRKFGIQGVVRSMDTHAYVYPGTRLGWHFAYMGGQHRAAHKLVNAAHIELARYGTLDNLSRCFATGEDLFGRPGNECVSVESSELPGSALDEKFAWMMGPPL